MIKFILKNLLTVAFIVSAFLSQTAQATLIQSNITSDSYITYNGIDIAWASKVNSERYYISLDEVNVLLTPDVQNGWVYGSTEQLLMLTSLSGNDLLALFTRNDGSYINAFEYWNTIYSGVDNTNDVLAGQIRSEWVWSIPLNDDLASKTDSEKGLQAYEITNTTGSAYDTFYFRVANSNNSGTPVPEPSTLLIFAMGLLALTFKARKQS